MVITALLRTSNRKSSKRRRFRKLCQRNHWPETAVSERPLSREQVYTARSPSASLSLPYYPHTWALSASMPSVNKGFIIITSPPYFPRPCSAWRRNGLGTFRERYMMHRVRKSISLSSDREMLDPGRPLSGGFADPTDANLKFKDINNIL